MDLAKYGQIEEPEIESQSKFKFNLINIQFKN